jgi:choline dehydrogenase-like flavoprotein
VSSSQSIIVVGGGTAGCTVVSYLAAHTDCKILLLEPGDVVNDDDESRFFELLKFDSVLHPHADGYVQAKMLGGGSAINGMLLTGDEPPHLQGLTRMATPEDCGAVGDALMKNGGRFSRLWWNGGRWNPGRAVRHLEEERRIMRLPRSATEVFHQDGRVIGVDCNEEMVTADVVVLCAGAIFTPQILLASGLATVNPSIGLGVQNHPTVTAHIPLQVENHAKFDASVVREWTTPNGGRMMNVAYERSSHLEDRTGSISVSLMNPLSRGTVGWDGQWLPIVDFSLLHEVQDFENMIHGVRDLLGLLASPAISEIAIVKDMTIEGAAVSQLQGFSDEQLGEWLRGSVKSVSHATSSCASAVEELGRVRGIENCWVADASVLPSVPSCTPAAPVTMEALRIARNIGESLT